MSIFLISFQLPGPQSVISDKNAAKTATILTLGRFFFQTRPIRPTGRTSSIPLLRILYTKKGKKQLRHQSRSCLACRKSLFVRLLHFLKLFWSFKKWFDQTRKTTLTVFFHTIFPSESLGQKGLSTVSAASASKPKPPFFMHKTSGCRWWSHTPGFPWSSGCR